MILASCHPERSEGSPSPGRSVHQGRRSFAALRMTCEEFLVFISTTIITFLLNSLVCLLNDQRHNIFHAFVLLVGSSLSHGSISPLQRLMHERLDLIPTSLSFQRGTQSCQHLLDQRFSWKRAMLDNID